MTLTTTLKQIGAFIALKTDMEEEQGEIWIGIIVQITSLYQGQGAGQGQGRSVMMHISDACMNKQEHLYQPKTYQNKQA